MSELLNFTNKSIARIATIFIVFSRYILLYILLNLAEAFLSKHAQNAYEAIFGQSLVLLIGFIFILFLAHYFDKIKLPWKSSSKIIWYSIIFGICITLTFIAGLLVISWSPINIKVNTTELSLSLLYAYNLAFNTAIAEELFYRGILTEIGLKHSSTLKTLIITSILFTLSHTFVFLFNLRAINIFLFGSICLLLRLKYRSIWAPILFHFIWNLSAALMGRMEDTLPFFDFVNLNSTTLFQSRFAQFIASIIIFLILLIQQRSHFFPKSSNIEGLKGVHSE